MEITILTPFTFTFAGVRNCPFWSLPLPCLGTCLLLVWTLLQGQETNTTNFSLKLKLQIRFFSPGVHFLAKKISSLDGQSTHVVLCLNSNKYFSEAYWNIFKRWWLRASQWVFAVFVTVMLAAIKKYTKWLDFIPYNVENKCWNWRSGATAPPLHFRALI